MPSAPATNDPSAAVAAWLAACPKIELGTYLRACHGRGGAYPAAPFAQKDEPITTRDFVAILCAIGAFEPLGATKPRACDIETPFDKVVEVPPATFDANGKLVPSFAKLIKICAPRHRALVVAELKGLPKNLTAAECGTVYSKHMQIVGFSEMFCPPGEPSDGEDKGTFSNVQHVVLCPGAGFDLFARNFSPYSPALFQVTARIWSTC